MLEQLVEHRTEDIRARLLMYIGARSNYLVVIDDKASDKQIQ